MGLLKKRRTRSNSILRNAQIIKKCYSDFWFWARNFVQYNKKEYGKI